MHLNDIILFQWLQASKGSIQSRKRFIQIFLSISSNGLCHTSLFSGFSLLSLHRYTGLLSYHCIFLHTHTHTHISGNKNQCGVLFIHVCIPKCFIFAVLFTFIFSMVITVSLAASSSWGLIISNSSCILLTSSAVLSSYTHTHTIKNHVCR